MSQNLQQLRKQASKTNAERKSAFNDIVKDSNETLKKSALIMQKRIRAGFWILTAMILVNLAATATQSHWLPFIQSQNQNKLNHTQTMNETDTLLLQSLMELAKDQDGQIFLLQKSLRELLDDSVLLKQLAEQQTQLAEQQRNTHQQLTGLAKHYKESIDKIHKRLNED